MSRGRMRRGDHMRRKHGVKRRILLVLFALLSLTLLVGCSELGLEVLGLGEQSSDDDADDDGDDLVPTDAPVVSSRSPGHGAGGVSAGTSIEIEFTDTSIVSQDLYMELFAHPLDVDCWFEWSGAVCDGYDPHTSINHPKRSFSGSTAVFAPQGGLESGTKYLVHLYNDPQDFKIYWIFSTK